MFLLEDAMNLLASTYAVQRVQRMLETLDKIECLMSGQALQTLAAEQIGNMKLHPLAAKHGKTYPDSLEREYARWGKRLADVLGVIPYPYSDRYSQGKGPGNSLSVRN
jgi:hypothetical protein